jgi:hypothetical protein
LSPSLYRGCNPRSLKRGQTSSSNQESFTFPIEEWWDGKSATGNWFGLRDRGLNLGAFVEANFLAVASGGIQQRPV